MFTPKIVLDVIDRLDSHPDEWRLVLSRIVHRDGCSVWIGNRTYGMDISIGDHVEWGNVTFLSTFGLSVPHHRLRRAADRWLARHRFGERAA
jgi:hypothetical protein